MAKPSRDSASPASVAIRRELARLAGHSRTRRLEYPCDWNPTAVVNPDCPDGLPFTPLNYWPFIAAKLLDATVDVVVMTMHDGKRGYVLKVPAKPHGTIYIKLQIGCGYVIGRSFHYSDHR